MRKLQVLFILMFSIVVVLILLLLHGPLQSNYHRHHTRPSQTLPLSNLQHTSTNLMKPYYIDDHYQQLIASNLSKMGYTLSDLPDPSELWTENVELCIMFNLNGVGINREVIELLIEYYHPFFSHLTLLFNGDPARTKKPKYLPSYVNVLGCDSHLGWYQHKCIRRCIQQGTTETKGFLYIPDDMFINVSKMAELPISKIWFVAPEITKYPETFEFARDLKKRSSWMWWGAPFNNAAKLETEINNLPPEWKDQLIKTAGFPDQFKVVATSDTIYIPRTMAPKMEQVLTHIIDTAPLFCEVATNLAVSIVAPDRVHLENGYLWGDRSIEGINRAAQTAHFVHPIKLGVKQHRDLWIQYMEKQLKIAIQRKKEQDR